MLTHPLDSVAEAQEHNRSGRTRGKVVVDMNAAPVGSRPACNRKPGDFKAARLDNLR